MDIIYTDKNRNPMGIFQRYSIDLDIGDTYDFQIDLDLKSKCMEHGSIWYIDNSEYGGIVDNIITDTKKQTISYLGRSWRGILTKKIIEPSAGADYRTVSGEAYDVLWQIITLCGLQDLMNVPDLVSGMTINYTFDRYVDAYTGIVKMLKTVNYKPQLRYNGKKIQLGIVPIIDYSEMYEYSNDCGIELKIEDTVGAVNHLICLGQGDLKDRTVRHLYLNKTGQVVTAQYYKGVNEIAEIYDYKNVESVDELIKSGTEKLLEQSFGKKMDTQMGEIDAEMYDIVGGVDRETGTRIKSQITHEIVKISNGAIDITYEVG